MNITDQPVFTEEQALIVEYRDRIRKLEAENKALQEREYQILKALPEIVFIIDLSERFIFLNNTCKEIFQLSKIKIDYNIQLKDVLAPESLMHVRKLYLKDDNKDTFHAKELKGIKKDGNIFPFTAYFSKLIENGTLIGFIGVGMDISERVEIESKLKEANLAKMKFLSIIAHDLRNPFNSLVGFSTLLLTNYQKYSDDKKKEYIQHMANASNQGYQLLENLLEWAKANTRKIDINPVFFDLPSTVAETFKLLEGNATKKEITIIQESNKKILVYADQNMVRTVIRNLLSNAIKFTHRKGKIILRTNIENDYANLEVIDNGVGIRPENLEILFSLSSDITSLGTERERGTGLGLIMCYEFVTLNNGSISAESTFGKGSKFKVKIPALKPTN
jgi:two-component system, sensor histidine kinase and response regulator